MNHTRIKRIPHPEDRREVPVSRGREQGDQLSESSPVHVGRGVGDRLEVHDQGIRPTGRHGALYAVADQHGHVVRECVDRDCRLDDDEGDATSAMTRVLADIGDRARSDGDDGPGPRDGAVGLGCRGLVGMKLGPIAANGDEAHVVVPLQQCGHGRLQVLIASADRGVVNQDDDVGAGRYQTIHGGDQRIQSAAADHQLADPDWLQTLGLSEFPPDRVEIERGRGVNHARPADPESGSRASKSRR